MFYLIASLSYIFFSVWLCIPHYLESWFIRGGGTCVKHQIWNLKFIIDMLIVNQKQLPIFSLFRGPLFFFLSCATLVPVVLLIVIDSTFIKFFAIVQSLRQVDSLGPYGLKHTTPPCPSPSPWVCSNTSIESVMLSSHLTLLMLMVWDYFRPYISLKTFPQNPKQNAFLVL